jgi:hypothetical protein
MKLWPFSQSSNHKGSAKPTDSRRFRDGKGKLESTKLSTHPSTLQVSTRLFNSNDFEFGYDPTTQSLPNNFVANACNDTVAAATSGSFDAQDKRSVTASLTLNQSSNGDNTSDPVTPANNCSTELSEYKRDIYWLDGALEGGIEELICHGGFAGEIDRRNHDGTAFCVIENQQKSYGISLPRFLAHLRVYTEKECRFIFRQVVVCVQVLHWFNVVHRNLNMHNIVVSRSVR